MSAHGTELPFPNVRSSVANWGKADKICSIRVLRIDPKRTSKALMKPEGRPTFPAGVSQFRHTLRIICLRRRLGPEGLAR
jgi:hypothetical protein